MFETLITAKMPPEGKKQPNAEEKRPQAIIGCAAKHKPDPQPAVWISRHEFVRSLNDLLEIKLDLTGKSPTTAVLSISTPTAGSKPTKEMLGSHFKVADRMLGVSFTCRGRPLPRSVIWVTNKITDSHKTCQRAHCGQRGQFTFHRTRANNGNQLFLLLLRQLRSALPEVGTSSPSTP